MAFLKSIIFAVFAFVVVTAYPQFPAMPEMPAAPVGGDQLGGIQNQTGSLPGGDTATVPPTPVAMPEGVAVPEGVPGKFMCLL